MKKVLTGRMGMLAYGLAVLVSLSPVRAETLDPLKAVPGDAWASLTIRNLGEFDNKLMALSQRLNASVGSPLAMLKGMMQLNGVNDDAGVSVVLMPMAAMVNPVTSMAILVPCEDYAAFTANMSVEEAVGGVSRCMLMGTEETYVAQMDGYAILGATPEGVQSVLATKGKPTIATTWSAHQLDRFAKDDITLHVNFKGVVASPMMQAMMPMFAAQSGGSFNPQEMMEMDSATISTRLDDNGLNLGFYWGTVPGSASAKMIDSSKPTSDSLLSGLPADNYLAAFGMAGSKEVFAKASQSYQGALTSPMTAMMLKADPTKMQELAPIVGSMVADVRHVSVSFNALPEGADGMFGLTKVVTFDSGAKAHCAKFGEIIKTITSGLFTDEAAGNAMKYISYKSGAETLGGVSVDHLAIAMDQMEHVTEKNHAELQKVFGSEVYVIRMAALDDKHMAVTLGGGKKFMEDVAGVVKGGGAPLGKNEGIKKIGEIIPKKKTFEAYASAENIVDFVNRFFKVVGEDPIPPFPAVGLPVALTGTPVGSGGFQMDLTVPMELVVAGKDYAMSMQGPPPGASSNSAPSKPADGG